MPLAAGGSAPDPDLKIMTPAGARSRAPTGVIVFPVGFPKGLSPFAAGGILPLCFLTFTQLSLVADDCKKLLVESMNAFLEPIRDRRKALDKDPKLVWDMLEAGNAKARARASRNLDALKKKLNFIFREGRKMLWRPGAQPLDLDLKNDDACWRAKPRANRRHCFPQGVSKGAQPLAAGGILPLCFLTFTQLSLVADDCKKLLVESMNAFLEPIRDRRKALTKTPSSSGTCSKPATPKPAPGPRGIWMRSRKS